MISRTNPRAVRRVWEGFNAHDLDVWDEVCTGESVDHDPGLPTPDADRPTLERPIGPLLAASPDLRPAEDDLIAAGNRIVIRQTLRGTHRAVFVGIAPTGKAMACGGIRLAHLEEGKLAEQGVSFDALGLPRRIGTSPG